MTVASDRRPAAAALRTDALAPRIGWICHSVRWGAAAWGVYAVVDVLLALHDRSGLLHALSVAFDFNPSSVSDARYAGYATLLGFGVATQFMIVVAVWRLTGAYLAGDIFSESTARALFRVGLAGVAVTLVGLFAVVAGLTLLIGGLSGHALLGIFSEPSLLINLLFCVFVMALGSALGTAAEIVAEYSAFV